MKGFWGYTETLIKIGNKLACEVITDLEEILVFEADKSFFDSPYNPVLKFYENLDIESYHSMLYAPSLQKFESEVELSFLTAIKNYTEDIIGINKQFKQENLTYLSRGRLATVSELNSTAPGYWKNPYYYFNIRNNVKKEEIEVYTIVPKTLLDGVVQIGALIEEKVSQKLQSAQKQAVTLKLGISD
eukprot:403345802